MNRHSINRFLNAHKTIKLKEKGALGEVFTPIDIIDDMLAQLPKRVWANKDLTWLDPACGIGQFPLKIIRGGHGYPGLFQGLAHFIPNESDRMKHILGQIHCYDMNPNNTKLLKTELNSLSTVADVNIVTGDFLQISVNRSFDIIVGNPPYNSGGTKRVGKKRVHVDFVKKCLNLLEPNGYLLFICPPNYRQAGSAMNRLFTERNGHFQHIHIYSPDETHARFKIQARVDSFLWVETRRGATTIIDEYRETFRSVLDLTQHVPNFGHSIFEKLQAVKHWTNTAKRSAEASTIGCTGFSSAFSSTDSFPILHLIIQDGLKILHRKKPHSFQDTPKLILNGLGIPYVYHDVKGEFGVSQTPVVILNPPARLVTFMKSPLFQLIVWALRLTGNNNLPYVLDVIPADFSTDFSWTAAERKLIESFENPAYLTTRIPISCKKEDKRQTRRKYRNQKIHY